MSVMLQNNGNGRPSGKFWRDIRGGDLLTLASQAVLFEQCKPARDLYFIEEGSVKYEIVGPAKNRALAGLYAPGQIVGECALAEDTVYGGTAKMLFAGKVWRVPRQVVLDEAKRRPELFPALFQLLQERQRKLERTVLLLSAFQVGERIRFALADLMVSGCFGASGDSVEIVLTQTELASYIGATRETTSAALKMMERQNCVKCLRSRIVLKSKQWFLVYGEDWLCLDPKAKGAAVGWNGDGSGIAA